MQVRTATLFIAAVPALVLSSFAYASGRADPDYPQISHSTQSRDEISAEAVRANTGIHATEIAESQPAPMMSGADRAQVQADAIRANNAMHPTEIPESQVAAPAMSANLQAPSNGIANSNEQPMSISR
jgi:hypothetical protein